ncbi:hypothetical protein DLM76_00650 [Leptospira yasudae]|nr:hypothetical protein DLM76_00650 [Leptospira yasudae]
MEQFNPLDSILQEKLFGRICGLCYDDFVLGSFRKTPVERLRREEFPRIPYRSGTSGVSDSDFHFKRNSFLRRIV